MTIKNGKVFGGDCVFQERDVWTDGERISKSSNDGEVFDATGLYVIPGLTDMHFHACKGFDFSDGTYESLQAILNYELENGITTVCPATMTFPEEHLAEVFGAASSFRPKSGSEIVGINMEGPFISMAKRGAQNGYYIQRPNAEKFRRLQEKACGMIKLVDLAPEVQGAMQFIDEVHGEVCVSIAHTTADYELAFEAFKRGASHATHLGNAMTDLRHNEPGVVGAAFDNEAVTVELICDAVHSKPAWVRAMFRLFGDERIVMISDSIAGCGMSDGEYMLGGQEIYVNGKLATLADGTIAGSVSNLMKCLRTTVKEIGIPLESAVKCAAVNPAKKLGVFDRFGSLETGKIANIAFLNKDLQLVRVMKDGKFISKSAC